MIALGASELNLLDPLGNAASMDKVRELSPSRRVLGMKEKSAGQNSYLHYLNHYILLKKDGLP